MKGFSSLIVLILIFSTQARTEEPVRFVIRVDDIQSRNTTMLPRSILDFEEAVASRGAKVSWAVIPHRLIEFQNQDGFLSEELRQSVSHGHEIIMHGYNHICPICGSSGHEMYCATNNQSLTYEQQQQLVIDGLQILTDSLEYLPAAFVPPGHHADATTWQVLVEEDFSWFSGTGPTKTMLYDNLYNLAPHNEYTWYLTSDSYTSKLNDALADVTYRGERDGYYCLLLHDPFIRRGYDDGIVIDWITELLDLLLLKYGQRLQFMTLSEAAESFNTPSKVHENDHAGLTPDFHLYANYPNPFNAGTVIRYSVASRHAVNLRVELAIYNIMGQNIKTLVSGDQPAGEYSARWNAGDVSSGIYYIRLTTSEAESGGNVRSVSRPCLLIK